MSRNFGTAGRRRPLQLLGAIISAIAVMGLVVVPAQAQLDRDLFELDKDATNNTTSTKVGVLNAAVATATDGSTTSIQICKADVPASLNGATVLIDAERLTLAAEGSPAGGGCPSDFPNKRNYTATRGVGVTVPGAHSKGEDVTLLTFGDDTSKPGNDWDQVYNAVNGTPADPKCASLGAVECTFGEDGRAESIFTQSKDYDEISDTSGVWKWRDQSVPDADELDHGFAAKYVDADDAQHLYFGADRFATNGTKDAGFWFFHADVAALDPVGTDDGLFSGTHTEPDAGLNGKFCLLSDGGNIDGGQASPVPACDYDDDDTGGDVLILTTFTGGGAVTTIRVFEWVGPAGTTAALLERGVASDCVPSGTDQSLCATVNDTTVESVWAYSGKGEPATNEIPSGGFLEGGVNLTDLGLEGCFSSFMATTRSSASLTADPKDFILGDFEACDTDLTTTPKTGAGGALAADTDGDNLDEISIGTGSVTVTDSAVLDVKGTTTFTGSLAFYICGPIDNPTACTTSGVNAGFAGNPVTANNTYTSNAVTLTSVGRYCWFATFTSGTDGVPNASDGTIESAGPPKSTGECFEVTPVTPTLTTTAVEGVAGFSPTIVDNLADVNGDGVADGDDDSNAFYGDTSIIDGALDCDDWTNQTPQENAGTAGDGTIDGDDDCTLIGYDGTTDGVEIAVEVGEFQVADGPLPTVFNEGDPDNPDISDSDFAWSTRLGRVDSNGDETITGDDCHVGIIGGTNILGDQCGFGTTPPAAFNGLVDLNGDVDITTADDSCSDGCFFGHDVSSGLVVAGLVDFGQPLYDVALLTGTANKPGTNGASNGGVAAYPSIKATDGAPANNSIEFTLVGPGPGATTCNSDPESDPNDITPGTGSNPESVSVTGDGFYPTTGFTPEEPGDYHWKASYPGDSPNTLGTSHNDNCDEFGEDVTVRQIPTAIATAQFWWPNDTATVTSSATGDLLEAGGTITFRLFGPTDAFNSTPAMTGLENCQADDGTANALGLVYSETSAALDGGTSDTASTTNDGTSNTDFAVTTNDSYYWRVFYTPAAGDNAHTGRISECVETFNITFTDDAGPGDVFP